MVDNTQEKEDISSLVTITLAISVVFLLGVIGYAYYTKDKVPKNKIVQFFLSDKLTFDDLPQYEKDKYVLKSSIVETIKVDIDEQNEMDQEESNYEVVEEEDSPSNRFLEKMAKQQKETDEMVIEGMSKSPTIEEESEPKNRFLEKMAKQQKETDEMVIEGISKSPTIEEESKPKNRFLEKMAKQQKETDEMILKGNDDNY